jgi:threonine/homoserine/homoserine lactone efflux protein
LGATLFFNGLLVGIIASVPVGAIAILSVQRTLNTGLIAGFVLGLGAAIADLIYAFIAAFGITFISDFLFTNRTLLGIIGSLFLLIIGYRIYFTNSVKEFRRQKAFSKRALFNDFFSSLVIALSNPITILGFGGVFASLGVIHKANTTIHLITLLAGVFTGALLWWFSLSSVVDIFRKKINLRKIIMINKVTGTIIYVLGIVLIVAIVFSSRYLFYRAPQFIY